MKNNRLDEVRADALVGGFVVLVEAGEVVLEQAKHVLAARRTLAVRVNAVGVLEDSFFDG